ncbi:DUF2076 family protein [Rhizobium sp. SSA_523]|uniref:DUF2076 domain-containing protein n=1 Tax=Rhizobium sp. SSA_523 TaxID=2952477 RepID=UPI002091D09B|nr:DUF2076 family protein [Rhizobium sp. SSA_523]MCO5730467.1 DUF2076 domain-containing protein [Rhizobium sp. SSA_523]WKC25508.1 DUF2076 family protein [Rhizobium sp. SSA_523]
MSPEERQLLTSLFDRVQGAAASPRDPQAEQLIAEAVRTQPAAPYYLAQAVIVQEKGLEAAAQRIGALETQISDLEMRLQALQAQAEADDNALARPEERGFLSSIFGSSQPPRAASPQPGPTQAARPGQSQSGPWGAAPGAAPSAPPVQQSGTFSLGQQAAGPWSQPMRTPSTGSSFLTGALGTAAGVAGGMLLANSLSGIFGHHMAGLGLGAPFSEGFGNGPVEETIINNVYGDAANDPPQIDAGNNQPDPTEPGSETDAGPDVGLQQADLDDGDGGWSGDFGGSGDDTV